MLVQYWPVVYDVGPASFHYCNYFLVFATFALFWLSLQIYPAHNTVIPCDSSTCGDAGDDLCLCTHTYNITLGTIVQMVFTVTVNNPGK